MRARWPTKTAAINLLRHVGGRVDGGQVGHGHQRRIGVVPVAARRAVQAITRPLIGARITSWRRARGSLPLLAPSWAAGRGGFGFVAGLGMRQFGLLRVLACGDFLGIQRALAFQLEPVSCRRRALAGLGLRAAQLGRVEGDQRLALAHGVAEAGVQLQDAAGQRRGDADRRAGSASITPGTGICRAISCVRTVSTTSRIRAAASRAAG